MIVEIPKETVEILEAYSYQVNSRKDIIIGVISESLSMDNERFIKYHKEYEEFYKGYQQAKNNLIVPYIKELFPDTWNNKNWTLDFSSGILKIED